MNYTKILVAIFIILLIGAAFSEYANAQRVDPVDDGPRISLGHTAFNKYETHGEFGYEWNQWEAAYSIQGSSGVSDTTNIASLSRVVKPEWFVGHARNYYRIGVSHVDNSDLVGDFNFRLGVGLTYKVFAVEYFHYSSAGINDTNSGIDGFMIRFNVPVY